MTALVVLLLACAPRPPRALPPPGPAAPALATPGAVFSAGLHLGDLDLSGDPRLAGPARDALSAWLALHPEVAADAGLLGDGLRVPTYAPAAVARHRAALAAARDRLAEIDPAVLMPADRVDHRLLVAAVETGLHALDVEQRWRHRPAEWLEPLSSLLLAHVAAAEPVPGAVEALAWQVPGLVAELRSEVTAPTQRDIDTAVGIVEGVAGLFEADGGPASAEAAAALRGWSTEVQALEGLPDHRMLGAAAYAWRLEHSLLLPWSAEELRAVAEAELARVDAEIAALEAQRGPVEEGVDAPGPDTEAALLDEARVLALHDAAVAEDLEDTRRMDIVTVPADLPPLRARVTPTAMVPLTGDGGSMNPVPFFGPTEGAWWNVSSWPAEAELDQKAAMLRLVRDRDHTWFGPYTAHEGVPGHHLQLAIFRQNAHPVRLLLASPVSIEGWALYAEGVFEAHGGFGGHTDGRLAMLRAWRHRVRRVIFDVNVETGVWTLQEAADWKHGAAPGEGAIDPELLRAVQWPTQLISYFAGAQEILALKAECREKWGADFSERRFHDALLAEGPVPLVLAREGVLDSRP